jgi:L-lysine exporter family protein LysE/ArgO
VTPGASDLVSAAVEGFLLGAGLIVAIGAQNAFVLRQGLLRQHVFAVATLCAASDLVLIAAGVAGLGGLVRGAPTVLLAVTLLGAAFLAAYGGLAFRRALHPGALRAAVSGPAGLRAALATAAALTWLNPHVYLDTVVLVGSLSARHEGAGAAAFGAGAGLASILWFYGLGFGARLAAPLFARPAAWRFLDLLIGVVMWAITARLVLEAWNAGTGGGGLWP